jgi:hypothetical protein
VAILEFLGIGARLEVFLEGVLADMVGSDGRDGGCIDKWLFRSLGSHICNIFRIIMFTKEVDLEWRIV